MELREILKKVVLLGDGAVGKTSLIARYVVNKFDDKYIATIGTKVSRKDIQVVKPNLIINLRMMIWDILGQKEYSKIRSASLSGAQGVILVGDLSRPETIQSLNDFWIKEAEQAVGKVPTVIVGNKMDLAEYFDFDVDYFRRGVEALNPGVAFFPVSCRSGEGFPAWLDWLRAKIKETTESRSNKTA